ncbi:MAG: hypothetical protein IT555_14240 [Acetobacteraceae bacterium]|nr:hypothetical protein [Acetobacteraceae bacterium]
MSAVIARLRTGLGDVRGASATEYAMMAGVLAVGLAAAFSSLASRLRDALNTLAF